MATRSDVSVLWNLSPRLIIVAAPSIEIIVQDLHDTLKDLEDEPGALQYPILITTAGKEDLGGSVRVGLTATLQNAKLMFERRATVLATGQITTASTPGTVVQVIDSAADFVAAGIVSGDFVLNLSDGGVGEVLEVSQTELLILSPTGGVEDDFDVGEYYNVYLTVECSISGGNLVATDSVGSPAPAVFPSFGTSVVRTSSSSATLQELQDIQYASFNGAVTVDTTSVYSGILYPVGTPRAPVNNIADAVEIASSRGFRTIRIIGDITLDAAIPSLAGFTFVGESANKTLITIDSDADVENSEFMSASTTGILDGGNVVSDCVIGQLNFVDGFITQCVLNGIITLSTQDDAHFLDCWSGVPGLQTPTIDFGGAGSSLAMRNYNGGITLRNKTGSESVSIDLNSGQIVLENTVTAGTIVLRGIGTWTNELTYTGGATVVNELIAPHDIQSSAFNGEVTVDVTSPYSGTTHPIGTTRMPVNNVADAVWIAQHNGFNKLKIVGSITLADGDDTSGMIIEGQGFALTTITVEAGAIIPNCDFQECTINGDFSGHYIPPPASNGQGTIRNSVVGQITHWHGIIYNSAIGDSICIGDPVDPTVGIVVTTAILGCYSADTHGSPPVIDFGGSGSGLVVRGWSGTLQLTNKDGPEDASVDMQGEIIIDDSVTTGTIEMRGIGYWENKDTYAGGADIHDEFVEPSNQQTVRDAMLLDPSPVTADADSIDNKLDTLAADVITQLNTQTYDGVAFSDILQDLLAMAKGKIVENPSNLFTFYEQNDSTPRFVLIKTGNQRLRQP